MTRLPRLPLAGKILAAFLFIALISALVVYALTWRATQSAFSLYTTQNGEAWAARLAPSYAGFYAQNGSWEGVEEFVQSGENLPTTNGTGRGLRRGQGMSMGMAGMGMGDLGMRLILADGAGRVIVDSEDELTGGELSTEDLAAGEPLLVDDQRIGTLFVVPAGRSLAGTTPASTFLHTVNHSLLIAVLVAGLLSLALAGVISLRITAPVRQMRTAAGAIARGDLDQRVPAGSNDELGDLAASFNHMADSLSAAEAQRRRLLADVAHELRTPLAAIQATAEGIQDGVLPFDRAQVDAIHSETVLLGRLVDDLRLLSLAEAGELRLERRPVDLGALLGQVAEVARPQCQARSVTLDLALEDSLPLLNLDADRISQVAHNLLANSLRYTPPGGRIELAARRDPDGGVTVSVRDSGSGIPPADLPHIFDRFYRADKSRARGSGGSGLGLAIVKQLVEAHGGRVWAESVPGEGAQVHFHLPLS